jgi:hypothetical protein
VSLGHVTDVNRQEVVADVGHIEGDRDASWYFLLPDDTQVRRTAVISGGVSMRIKSVSRASHTERNGTIPAQLQVPSREI